MHQSGQILSTSFHAWRSFRDDRKLVNPKMICNLGMGPCSTSCSHVYQPIAELLIPQVYKAIRLLGTHIHQKFNFITGLTDVNLTSSVTACHHLSPRTSNFGIGFSQSEIHRYSPTLILHPQQKMVSSCKIPKTRKWTHKKYQETSFRDGMPSGVSAAYMLPIPCCRQVKA